jgi:hypothetical protein
MLEQITPHVMSGEAQKTEKRPPRVGEAVHTCRQAPEATSCCRWNPW